MSHKEGGQQVQMTTETATWNDKPTVLYYVEYDTRTASKSNIVVTYWASPEGDKTFHGKVGKSWKAWRSREIGKLPRTTKRKLT